MKTLRSNFLKYIGPGLLVTVGFIDPGNWASNMAAGAQYGYTLLWVVTLSTFMLIILQHNAAHLGIVTGQCISESASTHLKPWISKLTLSTAVIASISTALAEILGGAIGLNMLFKLPIKVGAFLTAIFVITMLFTNSYKKLEKWIIGFVSLIGISFLIQLSLVNINWIDSAVSWTVPSIPNGSIVIIMSILGAVVMPHNLFLHSEIIQSRQWNLEEEEIIKKQLKYEFMDTFFSMIVGWSINSSMILVAAATFFVNKVPVTDLSQAQQMLQPLLGNKAAIIFAIALLFSGLSSSVTSGMAGGCIYAGIFKKGYNIKEKETVMGIIITVIGALIIIFFINEPFKALIYSQTALSIQLPITIFLQIYLTSSEKVMGKHKNRGIEKILLWIIAVIVSILNIVLLLGI